MKTRYTNVCINRGLYHMAGKQDFTLHDKQCYHGQKIKAHDTYQYWAHFDHQTFYSNL